jgi:hypothetical protein
MTAKMDVYKKMCYEFVARNRRLYGMELLKAPVEVMDEERKAIQQVYNNMRETCLKDPDYIKKWEHVDVKELTPAPEKPETPPTPEPPTEDNGSLVPA